MDTRRCKACRAEFTPKPMGYNALYCSKRCKARLKVHKPALLAAQRKRHYQRVKEHPELYNKHLAQISDSRKRTREWLAEYKKSRGCKDCGYNEFACALQLDHEGEKTASISELRSSVQRMLNEIEAGECVVRCANCHAVRTWRQKNEVKNATSN